MKTIHPVAFSVAAAALVSTIAFAQTSLPNTVFNPFPSRIVGQTILQQTSLTAIAPNNLEGREFNQPISIAVDTSATPAILYVADFGNNRVLAWKNVNSFTKGDFADKVIGQRDFLSSAPQGPGRELTDGFTAPTGIAVDKSGSLYVVDGFNNRILRYPAPFAQTGDLLVADLVIGQKDHSGRSPNETSPNSPLAAPSEKSLYFSNGGAPFYAGLAFDPQGNLWVSDPGNNRVLRFPVAALGTHASNEPAADLVLGQFDFVSNVTPPNPNQTPQNQLKNTLTQPAGIAVDPKGRVFVADVYNRVVVYAPPFSNGQPIARIMGVVLATQAAPIPPKISDTTLGALDSSNRPSPPNGVFFVGNNPYVVDSPNARILGYDPFDSWPAEATAFSPSAKVVIGQPSFQGFQSNRGLPQPNNQSLAGPQSVSTVGLNGAFSAIFAGSDMFVTDTGNNRVLVFPQRSGGAFDVATRLLGQIDFQYNSVNLIEGREMALSSNQNAFGGIFSTSGSVVIDPNSNPPHMYVSDPTNNRVLGYLDYRKVNAGTKADLVIGQPDLFTSLVNYPSNNPNSTTAQGLFSPEGLAVDADGNLYVADGGNGRLLRFPKPLDAPSGGMPTADLVLGQPGFNGQPIHDLSRQTMRSSYGVAFTFDGHLVVSDPLANRILFFRKPAGGFQSGVNADNVFGQPDFRSSSAAILNTPRLMSLDPDDHLYVADSGNNRIAIFPNVPFAGDNPTLLSSITGLSAPYGVVVNKTTREVWVANLGGNQVLRYPRYEALVLNPTATASFPSFAPSAISLDQFGNPVVAEAGANRIAFYFPAIDYTSAAGGISARYSGNAANLLQRFSPGMYAAIFPFQTSRFGDQTALFSGATIPFTLGDVQVFVGGLPAPLVYVSSSQINFVIPNAAPVNTVQEFQVVRASTGQLIASYLFKIDTVSPGLFTADGSGSGQIAAVNVQDNTINGPAHPVKAGQYLTLFGTGQGPVSVPQKDGVPASGTVFASGQTRVIINVDYVPDDYVQFSGLAPGFVGLWQVNVKIPANVAPGIDIPIAVVMNGVTSSQDPLATGLVRRTTFRAIP